MEKNDYLYGMLKSEEHTVEVLTSDLHEERRLRRAAEKGKRESDRRAEMLEKKADELQTQLTAKIDEISSLMQQLVQFMMGNGAVSLSESVKDSVIAGVRAEYERREAAMRQSYELEIAALRNENNALKNKDGQNPSSGSPSSQGEPSIETRLESAEQQRANLAVTAHGQRTESGKYHHGSQQVEEADTLDLNGEDVSAEQLYKCYDTTELIVRVACLVHMRRPIFKLRHVFKAGRIVQIIDLVFHLDKEIKKNHKDKESIREQRCLQIAPLLNDLKSELESLLDALDPAKEPELLKAVNYALKEYPCILHCLEDGTVDFSNNCCERQIRRIAKYRNNSFFVGSPAAGKRFARLQSVFGNIRNHKLNPQIYLCDVFRNIKKIAKEAKEEMVNLLANRWQPGLLQAKLNY